MQSGFPPIQLSNHPAKQAEAPKPAPLSADQLKVLSFIEQTYFETGLIPVESVVAARTGITLNSVKRYWQDKRFLDFMTGRGIDLTKVQDLEILEPRQLALANLLLNMHDKNSVRAKLEAVNVTSQQYHAWLRDPKFQSYLRKRAEETFKASDAEAYLGLTKAVQNGDVKAIQLFFEMRGIYNPRMQIDLNIEVVLTKVIEIISKHVTDDKVLNAIATDFEQIGK